MLLLQKTTNIEWEDAVINQYRREDEFIAGMIKNLLLRAVMCGAKERNLNGLFLEVSIDFLNHYICSNIIFLFACRIYKISMKTAVPIYTSQSYTHSFNIER
jgi:hypothetical protein